MWCAYGITIYWRYMNLTLILSWRDKIVIAVVLPFTAVCICSWKPNQKKRSCDPRAAAKQTTIRPVSSPLLPSTSSAGPKLLRHLEVIIHSMFYSWCTIHLKWPIAISSLHRIKHIVMHLLCTLKNTDKLPVRLLWGSRVSVCRVEGRPTRRVKGFLTWPNSR